MSGRIEKLLPFIVGAAIVIAMAAYRWVGGAPESEDAADSQAISNLQLSPDSHVDEVTSPGYCASQEDCAFDRQCRIGRCRRPVASLKMFDSCAYNDECPAGTTCQELRCRPLRRERTGPDYRSSGGDWAQFRGPSRTAVSPEKGLERAWPTGGPPQLWSASLLGLGFGHPAIANGKVFTMGMYGAEGRITALDLDGRELWQIPYGPEWRGGSYRGARQTPTVDGERVFLASGHGILYALDANSGAELWQQDLFGDEKKAIPRDGFADAPLLVDGRVILLLGSEERLAVAYSAATGELLWTTPGGPVRNAYGALIPVQIGNRKVVAGLVQQGQVAIDAATGELLWLDTIPELDDTHLGAGPLRTFASPPIYRDGELVRTLIDYEQGARLGARMVRLDGTTLRPTTAWNQPAFGVHYGGAALWNETLYGVASYDRRQANPEEEDPQISLMAVHWATGKIVGDLPFKGIGKAPLIIADGLLIAYGGDGIVVLVEVNGGDMRITGRLRINFGSGPHITYPALADGILYIRHHATMATYDLRQTNLLEQ
jgi:outer membrane protein assembly factor BamB